MLIERLIRKAADVASEYGFQYDQTQEELGELEVELRQSLRDRNNDDRVATEAVDALFMLGQYALSRKFELSKLYDTDTSRFHKPPGSREELVRRLADDLVSFKMALRLDRTIDWVTFPTEIIHRYAVPGLGIVPNTDNQSCINFGTVASLILSIEVLVQELDREVVETAFEQQMRKLDQWFYGIK